MVAIIKLLGIVSAILISSTISSSVFYNQIVHNDESNEEKGPWGICEDGVDGWMIETRELWFDAPNGSKVPVLEQRLRLSEERWGKASAATHLVARFDEQFPDGDCQADRLMLMDFEVTFSPTDNGLYLDHSNNKTMEYEKEKNQDIPRYRPQDGDLTLRYNFDKGTLHFDNEGLEYANYDRAIQDNKLFQRGYWVTCYYYFMNETGPVGSAHGDFISSGWTSTTNLMEQGCSGTPPVGLQDGALSK